MADDTLGMTFDMRRKARGAEPQVQPGRFKRRLVIACSVSGTAVLVVAGLWIYWALTYVGAVRATVCASVVSLSIDYDALLATLAVHEGDHVVGGQSLATLDDAERRAALAGAEALVSLAMNRYEVAVAQIESAKAALTVATIRTTEGIRRAEANLKSSQARLKRLANGARPEDVEVAQARLASALAVASLYRLQLSQSEALSAKGIESELDVAIMKTRLATQQNLVREAELEVKKLEAGSRPEEIEEATQDVAARTADVALAHASREELRRLELDLESSKALLRQAQAERDEADANVRIRRSALEKTVIKSPIAGTVVRVYYTAGEVVRKGEPVVEVADDARGRWVECFVAEDDVEDVKPGQPVSVEVGVDSGVYVDGIVDQMGFATSSAAARLRGYTEAGDYGRPAPTWVRIAFADPALQPRPGTSANVRIRVR